jgi:serine/threonine protein kinase
VAVSTHVGQPVTQLMIGTELGGRYVVERALGRGGVGKVFQALDRDLHRRVAVKLLLDERADVTATERFRREARAAAAIEHPNACRLYELGEHEGQTFLVMELLDGELLSDRLQRGAMPLAEAQELLLPLMDAVATLHRAGLIHRDLKPSNVFLTAQGIKLLDFGLARHTRPDEAVTSPAMTVAGAVAGTLRYMAPEQLTGDPVDERTDVFALGVMFYEMLTGRIPFAAESNVDWVNAVLREEPQPLGVPGLDAIEPVVQRALQRRAADRFESVEAMAAAIESVMSGGGEVAARAPSPPAPSSGTIVVLPFMSLKPDPDIAFLQQGIPEGLTAALSADGAWQVISNRDAMKFDGTADMATIGKELGAGLILTGSFLRSGSQVRLTTQLVNAAGSVQWSQSTDHEFGDLLALQDACCQAILTGLADHAPPAETAVDVAAR